MKNVTRNGRSVLTIAATWLCASAFGAGIASAATTVGTVTYLSTFAEIGNESVGLQARAIVRVKGTCDNETDPNKERVIYVRSGRTDGMHSHNAVTMKNAYSTLLSAFLSGKRVELRGLTSCGASSNLELPIGSNGVGILN